MHVTQLTADEIDDLLYFTRVNEPQELSETIAELRKKYQCSPKDVLEAAIAQESGNSVLHFAAANGFSNLLFTFFGELGGSAYQAGQKFDPIPALLNKQNAQGSTPLHWAALNGHLDAVKLLVVAGADMWIKNSAGHLAMFEAERADKSDVVQYLLEAGGKEVERTGKEGHASAEDVPDVEDGQAGSSNGSPNRSGSAHAAEGADVVMGDDGHSG